MSPELTSNKGTGVSKETAFLPAGPAAPFYNVPCCAVTSVEHPFVIKNVTKAVESLGGPDGVVKVCGSQHIESVPPLTTDIALSYSSPGWQTEKASCSYIHRIECPNTFRPLTYVQTMF